MARRRTKDQQVGDYRYEEARKRIRSYAVSSAI